VRSSPKENNGVDTLEPGESPDPAPLRVETAKLEIRKDCHKAPRVIHVELKSGNVSPEMVEYFGKLGQVVKAIPSYPVIDIPGYFKMGFCLGTPEIYIWVRQKPQSDFEQFLVSHLERSLQ
jgi:hypothetical protein